MLHANLARFPLAALRAFETTARLGSIKAAADELVVTPSAVSHQVQVLETHLGVMLFERLHRGLRPTPAGELLGHAVSAAFGDIGRVLDDLAQAGMVAGGATLSVSAAPTFAAKWLAPRLDAFQSAHPRIMLRLRADDALTDPARNRQVDVAIRYGRGPYAQSLRAERLWNEGVVVAVCAPEVAERLARPGDLVRERLLRTATPPVPGMIEPIGWAAWFAAAGESGPEVERAIATAPRVGTTQLALEAAGVGGGVALSPMILVVEDLREGRLQMPFVVELTDPYSFWMLYRHERAEEAPIRSLITWLRGEAAA